MAGSSVVGGWHGRGHWPCRGHLAFKGRLSISKRWVVLAGALAWAVSTGALRAEIVVDQQPVQGGGPASDTEFFPVLGDPTFQLIADNVMLDQDTTILRTNFWGFFGGDFQNHLPPDGPEEIRIRFYEARSADGLPDDNAIFFEETFLNPSRTPTGLSIAVQGAPAEFFYEVDLGTPVTLLANTPYWLEIVQVGDLDSHFRWETGFGVLSGHAVSNDISDGWQPSGGSFAFQLSTIPEPQTAVLFAFTFSIMLARRGRRRRSL